MLSCNSIGRAVVFAFALSAVGAQQLAAQESPAAARMAAAAELMKAMKVDAASLTAGDQVEEMMGQFPNAAAMQGVLKDFMAKYLPGSKLLAEMTRLYAAAFTAQELRELAAFYRTPLGQKAAKVQPKITSDVGRFTQAETMKHVAELQQMIMQKMNN